MFHSLACLFGEWRSNSKVIPVEALKVSFQLLPAALGLAEQPIQFPAGSSAGLGLIPLPRSGRDGEHSDQEVTSVAMAPADIRHSGKHKPSP